MVQWSQIFTPKIRQVAKYCAWTFFIGFGSCTLMYRYSQVKFATAPHCVEALQILLSHKEAVDALGPPIGVKSRFNVGDRKSYRVDDKRKTFWMKLPVEGQLDSGNLYVDGVYDDSEKTQVTRMDLSLKRREKRFRIFELDKEDLLFGKNLDRTTDEDELDEDVIADTEKRKWFDLRWFSASANKNVT